MTTSHREPTTRKEFVRAIAVGSRVVSGLVANRNIMKDQKDWGKRSGGDQAVDPGTYNCLLQLCGLLGQTQTLY
jgi:hypothetical protein